MLVDSHCHLDDPRFDPDRTEVWSRARAVGVLTAVIPAVEPARWDHTLATALAGERFVALGIHPQAIPGLSVTEITAGMDRLVARCRAAGAAVVAVGECGFDGTIDLSLAPWERQRAVFYAHVEAARALDLPLVVHVLRAHGEALGALRSIALPRTPGVIHSCSASAEIVRAYLSLGFHIGFAGGVTRPTARRVALALRAVPDHRLLLETDAPDQTPTGVPPTPAGTPPRCEPAHLTVTLARVAALREVPTLHIARVTTENARDLFRLPRAPDRVRHGG